MFFSIELIAGVLTGLVIATVIMMVLQIRNSVQINKLTFPAYEYVVKQAEHKANEILNQAQKEARGILAEAEKSGQKAFATYNQTAVKTQETYSGMLEKLSHELTDHLAETAKKGGEKLVSVTAHASETISAREKALAASFDASLEEMHTFSTKLQSRTEHALSSLEKEMGEIAKKLTEGLHEHEVSYKKEIATHLERALEVAEHDIDSYKKARIAVLDMHIEKLVEEVTAKVLHKKLSVEEHGALARAALVEAKEQSLL
jgi:F0F1-type ATP synthase membrane subunit b/b'